MEISESEVDLELKSRFESAEENIAVHKMLSSFFDTDASPNLLNPNLLSPNQ